MSNLDDCKPGAIQYEIKEPSSVLSIGKSDADRAAELRVDIRARLDAICAIMNQSRRDGLRVNFTVGIDGFGQYTVQAVDIVKPL